MLYGEYGRKPLWLTICLRIICFWARLIMGKSTKLSLCIYRLMYHDFIQYGTNYKWIMNVRDVFYKLGLNYIWDTQHVRSLNWLKETVKLRLGDQYLQYWHNEVFQSTKSLTYRLIKENLELEAYFNILSRNNYITFLRFRLSNHFLPIEKGRWSKVPRENRICTLCSLDEIGDEFHYLFICDKFKDERSINLKKFYTIHPNVIKFKQLFNCKKAGTLRKLCHFINIINKVCSS
jgi:hypothetical protein